MELYQLIINQAANALDEDVGSGDISAALIDAEARLETELLVREDAVLCGCQWFDEVFRQCDERINIHWLATDGDNIPVYSIIYQAIEEIKLAIEGLLEPTKEEKIVANVEIREVYKISKVGTVAGCCVSRDPGCFHKKSHESRCCSSSCSTSWVKASCCRWSTPWS